MLAYMKSFWLGSVMVLLPVLLMAQLGYTESGEASYYADKFNGKLTASGERFNNSDLTAAHRVLPFGSRVLVTNTANGNSVVVRINDRGPFKRGRIIDLSRTAAKALGMLEKGVAEVTIEVVDVPEGAAETEPAKQPTPPTPEPKPTATPPATTPKPAATTQPPPANTPAPVQPAPTANEPFAPGGTYNLWGKPVQYDGFCLQLGAFSTLEKAKEVAGKVKDAGYPTVYIRVQGSDKKPLYKVVQGVYSTEAEARSALATLKQKGFSCFLSHYRQL